MAFCARLAIALPLCFFKRPGRMLPAALLLRIAAMRNKVAATATWILNGAPVLSDLPKLGIQLPGIIRVKSCREPNGGFRVSIAAHQSAAEHTTDIHIALDIAGSSYDLVAITKSTDNHPGQLIAAPDPPKSREG